MSATGYSLVMPFVVCASTGGPYDDGAFAAGVVFGQHWEQLAGGLGDADGWGATVRTVMVPQYRLLAEHLGLALEAEPCGEAPDEWTLVTLSRPRLRLVGDEGGTSGP